MSLRAPLFSLIPEETMRVARAAFPQGNVYMRMRDELGPIYDNAQFADLFPPRQGGHSCRVWAPNLCGLRRARPMYAVEDDRARDHAAAARAACGTPGCARAPDEA
jgi:hypothetical protein